MTTRPLSAHQALLVGHLMVNGPVLGIIVGGGLLGWTLSDGTGRGTAVGVIAGSLIAWPWWSLAVPRWRAWALARGVNAEKLQRLALMTGLVWPKGSIFEKTELPPREHKPPDGGAA